MNFNLPVEYNNLKQNEKKLVREQYIQQQSGVCHYCKHPLAEEPPKEIKEKEIRWNLFPPNFLKYPVHLHHDHQTGLTIGAVHSLCNAILWQYEGK